MRPMPPVRVSPRPMRRWAMLLASKPAKPCPRAASSRRRVSASIPPNMARGSSRMVLARYASGTFSASARGRISFSTPSRASAGTCAHVSNRAQRAGRAGAARRARAGISTGWTGQGCSTSRFCSRASSACRRSSLTALPGRYQGPPSIWISISPAVKGVPPVLARLRRSASAGSVRAGWGPVSP